VYDQKHVGVKEFYMILMCFLTNMCMSWLLLTLLMYMYLYAGTDVLLFCILLAMFIFLIPFAYNVLSVCL